jgi:GNAT superfamily N-acetyltransferase
VTARRFGKENVRELEVFLSERESRCIPLTARLKREPRWWKGPSLVYGFGSPLRGILYAGETGHVYPCFDELPEEPPPEALLWAMPARNLSVLGPAAQVSWVESAAPPDWRKVSIDYRSMVNFRPGQSAESRAPDLEIRRCVSGDLNRLFPLHKAYEIEEVLVQPARYQVVPSYVNFRKTLASEVVYWGLLDGEPVCKANTNARGWRWDQIGGVYTTPRHRGKGYGAAVLQALERDIARERAGTGLFVKTDNAAANALYEKLGYEPSGPYRITYLRKV